MTKYRVDVSIGIYPLPDDPAMAASYSSNSLFHSQKFEISGEKFSDIAPTIDGIYKSVQDVLEAHNGDAG